MQLLALIEVTVLLALAGLHLFWAGGGRWAASAVLPERAGTPVFRPGPLMTLGVAGALMAAVLLLAARAGLNTPLALPPSVATVGSWLVAGAFLLRALGDFRYVGLFRRVKDTPFAERDARLFTPVAVALGLGAAIIAWWPQ